MIHVGKGRDVKSPRRWPCVFSSFLSLNIEMWGWIFHKVNVLLKFNLCLIILYNIVYILTWWGFIPSLPGSGDENWQAETDEGVRSLSKILRNVKADKRDKLTKQTRRGEKGEVPPEAGEWNANQPPDVHLNVSKDTKKKIKKCILFSQLRKMHEFLQRTEQKAKTNHNRTQTKPWCCLFCPYFRHLWF